MPPHDLNLVVDLNILLSFFGGLRLFSLWFRGFERFATSHKQVRDILWKGFHTRTGKFSPSQSWCSYFFEATNQILYSSPFLSWYSYFKSFCKRRIKSYKFSSILSWVNSDVMIPSVCKMFFCFINGQTWNPHPTSVSSITLFQRPH